MGAFPIIIDLHDRPVTIVGGGAVAARKCQALLDAGARVTVVAPEFDERLEELRRQGRIALTSRHYCTGDLAGAFLVFAATDSLETNRCVADEAASRGILADITGEPARGTFTTPAILRRGNLLITVSTGGASPALAARLREELADLVGPEYAETLQILGKIREKLLTAGKDRAYNEQVLRDLAASALPKLLRARDHAAVDRLLASLLGPNVTLDRLEPEPEDPA